MAKLSIAIITFNEEANIERCIIAAKPIADEIVVVDGLSTDKTVSICEAHGCKVVQRKFTNFSDQKQFAVDQTNNDWVFILDADEELTEALRKEIKSLFSQSNMAHAGYKVPRSLFYLGKILRFSGVRDKPVLRIFHKQTGQFNGASVHEEIVVKGSIATLHHPMIHYSYRNLAHHIQKLNTYTTHAAEEYHMQGKRFPKGYIALKFPINFLVYFILKGGILDGYPGFWWSVFAAFNSSVKLAKANELQSQANT